MTNTALLEAIRCRIVDPALRIDMKTVATPPLYPPATPESVTEAEATLGLRLPSLVRQLYVDVANGGFGPGAGLLGLAGGYSDAEGRTLVSVYQAFAASWWPKPTLLPLWDWGCGAWSCVDADAVDERVFTMDAAGPTRTRFTLPSWLSAWVSGTSLFEETFETNASVIVNPFTRKPVSVQQRGPAKGGA